jgi:putative ABC transport system permease protein
VLRTEIPGIKRVAEALPMGQETHDLWTGDKKLYLNGGTVAPDFLQMFRFPFVEGAPLTAFKDPHSIIIDQSTARALFGDNDPMGQAIRIDNRQSVKVTGVIKDIPANSSLRFSYLLPLRK